MFSKVKKEVLFVRIILKDFSRSAVSFEGSGATDWRADGPLYCLYCTCRLVQRYLDCQAGIDREILLGIFFAFEDL